MGSCSIQRKTCCASVATRLVTSLYMIIDVHIACLHSHIQTVTGLCGDVDGLCRCQGTVLT